MRSRALSAAIVLAITASRPIDGRLAASSQRDTPASTFSSRAELVVLHVVVRDKKGAYVGGLGQDAFRILEDNRPQAISFFSSEDAPVTVGVLVDSSGSMMSSRELVIAAGVVFAETSNPNDELFVLGFNENVRAALPPAMPFTHDIPTLRVALARATSARGRTALYDALSAGIDDLANGQYERKVLIVISDGGDNASSITRDQAIAKVQRSNALVYAVGLVDPLETDADPGFLDRLAKGSGGEAFFPHDARHLGEQLGQVAREIRNTYTIGYVPANSGGKAGFRAVRVAVHSPDRRSLVVRTRQGYLAGPGEGP